MAEHQTMTFEELAELARSSSGVTRACPCALDSYREWTRVPADFPQAQMRTACTLTGDPYLEPTYAEYHPHGSAYWSADAPIAPRYFPYNRCTAQQCTVCGRSCLRYVEAGGYYVEPRIRALDPSLLVDAPLDV
ncbi:hypothetical protein ACI48D_16215 [Massilia sp. LXY-6]|uniref:hypothetical protein n=1 Tax=Massilia sp. LXY-6 TaxID=3379823 RepID=UPI003EDFDFAF